MSEIFKVEKTIAEKLREYLKETPTEDLELAPASNIETKKIYVSDVSLAEDLELVKKDNASKITSQLQLVAKNIIFKFFELNDEKFLLMLDKIRQWGFEVTFEQFILNYYLYIKRDNRLRTFVVINMARILRILSNEMEDSLIRNMTFMNFTNSIDKRELANLRNDLFLREKLLQDVTIKEFDMSDEEDINTAMDKVNVKSGEKVDVEALKSEILEDLKKNNELLEADF